MPQCRADLHDCGQQSLPEAGNCGGFQIATQSATLYTATCDFRQMNFSSPRDDPSPGASVLANRTRSRR